VNLFPELFTIRGVPVAKRIPDDATVTPPVWNDRLELPIDELRALDLADRGVTWDGPAPPWDRQEATRRYSADVSHLAHEEDVVVIWSGTSLQTLVQSLKFAGAIEENAAADDVRRQTIREGLAFHPAIDKRITDFRGSLPPDCPTLGVHYRKTDEAAKARSIPTESQYLAATDRALSKMPDNTILFLATDNADVQALYQQRYGSGRVRWTEKWLPEAGRSIHKNADCPDGVAAARDALVDIGLLASCDALVLTGNSSFSSLAAWFSARPRSKCQFVFPARHSPLTRLLAAAKRLVHHSTSEEK